MSLLLIFTLDGCLPCRRLDTSSFYLILGGILAINHIPFKRFHASTWNELGVENGPRDKFHDKLKRWAPLFSLVPEGAYCDIEHVTDEELLTMTKVFNGKIENGVLMATSDYDTFSASSMKDFIIKNADTSLDTKMCEDNLR